MSDHENTIHLPPSDEDHTDNASTKSSVSASKQKQQCPHCNKELQTTALFRHIRKLHPGDFTNYMAVWDIPKLEALYTDCQPFPLDYTTTDDFDETVFHKFYGCLSCNNTFTNQARAHSHCKDKKCRKEHLSEFKKIIAQEKADKKTRAKPHKPKQLKASVAELILEVRRYKYILKLSYEINTILADTIAKESGIDMSKAIAYTPYTLSDYQEVANISNAEDYEKIKRRWIRRLSVLEDDFCRLRDYLYYCSYARVDKYVCKTDDRPNGRFIGQNYHETMGPEDYPALTDSDESLIGG